MAFSPKKVANLGELFRLAGVDLTSATIEIDSGTRIGFNFGVNPEEFLSFAKADQKQGGKRGLVNSLSNAKRAIDSQIDRVLRAMGYDPESLPAHCTQFAHDFCDEQADIPLKLRLISAFGMAPSSIVSGVRSLRHKTEHEYTVPTEAEAKQAVEIAELFLSASERRLIVVWEFEITDSRKNNAAGIHSVHFTFTHSDHSIDASCFEPSSETRYHCSLQPQDFEHAIMFRMCFLLEQEEELLGTLRYLLKKLNHPIPSDKVRVSLSS